MLNNSRFRTNASIFTLSAALFCAPCVSFAAPPIQMLPPATETTKTATSPTACPQGNGPQILTWDGQYAITCTTGVTASSGNVSATNMTATSNISATNVTASQNVTASDSVSAANVTASQNVTATNVSASGNVAAVGSIDPGTTFVTGNNCSPEGALGYDMTHHTPVYCNSGSKWAQFGATGNNGSNGNNGNNGNSGSGSPCTIYKNVFGQLSTFDASPYSGVATASNFQVPNLTIISQIGPVNPGVPGTTYGGDTNGPAIVYIPLYSQCQNGSWNTPLNMFE